MEWRGGDGRAVEARSAGVALPLGGYTLTVDLTGRTEPAKESVSSFICLAQAAGSVAEARRPPPSSLRV